MHESQNAGPGSIRTGMEPTGMGRGFAGGAPDPGSQAAQGCLRGSGGDAGSSSNLASTGCCSLQEKHVCWYDSIYKVANLHLNIQH